MNNTNLSYLQGCALTILAGNQLGICNELVELANRALDGKKLIPLELTSLEAEAVKIHNLLSSKDDAEVKKGNLVLQTITDEYLAKLSQQISCSFECDCGYEAAVVPKLCPQCGLCIECEMR